MMPQEQEVRQVVRVKAAPALARPPVMARVLAVVRPQEPSQAREPDRRRVS